MASIFVRTVIIYALLLVAVRVMGKRQVGELEVSELIITFLLSELAVLPLSNVNAPITHGIVPVVLLISAEVIFSFLTSRSPTLRKIMLGKPSIIINKGVLDEKELSRLRISAAELMSELRLKGVASPEEVYYAIIEDNGQLSVFKKAKYSPLTPDDAGTASTERGIAHFVITDGKISDSALSDAGLKKDDLYKILKEKGAAAADIHLMSVDDGGGVFIIKKGRNE